MTSRRNDSLGLAPASVDDYRELARRRLPRQLFDYIDGGAFDEVTLRANRADLEALAFRQRVLRDVSERNLGVTVLGEELSMPLILAPVGFGGMFARRAEVQVARAAEESGVVFVESTLSICSLDEVSAAVSRPPWFQLYVMKDRSFAEDLMARAWAAGVRTLILTVDLPVVGQRYRDARNGIGAPINTWGRARRGWDLVRHARWVRDVALGGKPLSFGNLTAALPEAKVPTDFQRWVAGQFDPSVTWKDLDWVRENWKGRVALKGILDADDARAAVKAGADGIIVSNHGGRQLDGVPSSIKALPKIAEAVHGRAEVLMDGGVRSGLDVAKALALGASACLIGRPWAYAVAAGGQRGVKHTLAIMREELRVTLGLTGLSDVAQLSPDALVEH